MRTVDADALKKIFDADEEGKKISYNIFVVHDKIDSAPTISEHKMGKWVHGREIWREHIGDAIVGIGYEDWRCSECHTLVKDDASEVLWKYCPWCGAKMEGVENMIEAKKIIAMEHSKYRIEYVPGREWDYRVLRVDEDVTESVRNNVLTDVIFELMHYKEVEE